MKYDALIFDIDGVLIDVRQSYTQAAIDAVEYATGSDRFSAREIACLKAVPGFNDDWHVAIAGAVWQAQYSKIEFPDFVALIGKHGAGMDGLRKLADPRCDPVFEAAITKLAKEAYGGMTRCETLYGFVPRMIKVSGAWQTEVPLLSASQIEPVIDRCGIVTGRSRVELGLAYDLLGWSLPASRVATADKPEWIKPNPRAIRTVMEQLQCHNPLYVGDSRDDLRMVQNARSDGINCEFCYVGNASPPWAGIDITVKSVTELFKLLEV